MKYIQYNLFKKYIIFNLFRYDKELQSTQWSSIRQGAIYGIFFGWIQLIFYIVHAVGFIFGSILMSHGDSAKPSLSDILIVSAVYDFITQKISIQSLSEYRLFPCLHKL